MKQLTFVFTILFIFSCQKDTSSDDDSTKKLPFELKGMGSDNLYNRYYYDDKNRIIGIVRVIKGDSIVVKYQSDGNIEYAHLYNSGEITIKSEYVYDGNKVTQFDKHSSGGPYEVEEYWIYTITPSGILSSIENMLGEVDNFYYDNKGNVSYIERTYPTCPSSLCYTETFYYNEKNAIFSGVRSPEWFITTFIFDAPVTKSHCYKSVRTSQYPETSIIYTCTYDSDNFPITFKDDKGFFNFNIKYIPSN